MEERPDISRLRALNIPSGDVEVEGGELGRGSYGKVQRGRYQHTPVAIKNLHKIFFEVADAANQKSVISTLLTECDLLSRLNHENVVRLYGVVKAGTPDMLMITELMDVSLDKRYASFPLLTRPDEIDIAYDVVNALTYLHSQGILHRDLAPKNILLKDDEETGLVAKVADVGLAKVLQTARLDRVEGTVCPGTQSYMPPEALMTRTNLCTAPAWTSFRSV